MLLPRHALALGPAVQRDLARDDVGVEEAARAKDARHLGEDRSRIAQVLDLRLVDEVEDVAPRRIEELAVADGSIPCRGVALAIARLMPVIVSFVQRRRRDVRLAATSCCTRWRDSPKTSPASRRLRRSSPVSLVAASVAEVCALACC